MSHSHGVWKPSVVCKLRRHILTDPSFVAHHRAFHPRVAAATRVLGVFHNPVSHELDRFILTTATSSLLFGVEKDTAAAVNLTTDAVGNEGRRRHRRWVRRSARRRRPRSTRALCGAQRGGGTASPAAYQAFSVLADHLILATVEDRHTAPAPAA
ncbi:hypothetical protein OsJ_06930 [Oryza sativa Japonica Group]|uniref:Uncharacterized protein n=1 Tax=Oryza sativa subsp. japonica TaxID=39947 RepID=B9F0A0_ORYSJ|nr:hypothetical protein OsJ_06930 [Oryza sativa Japonica Group]